MHLKFKNYNMGFKIVSLALDENTKDKLTKEKLSFIYVNSKVNEAILFPEKISLSKDSKDIKILQQCNNYDVFELWDNGILAQKYNDQSEDNYFFITGKCNSNCIMCPSSEHSRKHSQPADLAYLLDLAQHIPQDVPHLTITGGEPFLMGEQFFTFLEILKEKFTKTEFLFLTNGRIFAIDKYLQMFCETIPHNSIVAIPLHGSCKEIHDIITRTNGSFNQTVSGIKKLLKNNILVEIRLVVNKINIDDFDNIAKFITKELKGIAYVSIIAMEMTGTARVNYEKVWIPYHETFNKISNSVRILLQNGIDVKLYNFPLCTVDKTFWMLCEKSISDNKVRFADQCQSCKLKNACSGVFAGTLKLETEELKAIL